MPWHFSRMERLLALPANPAIPFQRRLSGKLAYKMKTLEQHLDSL
jgi:hypothetical protein